MNTEELMQKLVEALESMLDDAPESHTADFERDARALIEEARSA